MDATNQHMQWRNIVLMIVLTFVSATACSESPATKSNETTVDSQHTQEKTRVRANLAHADRDDLQTKATAACECTVANGKDCWSDYQAAIKPFQPKGEKMVGAASACAPVSTEADCLEDATGEFCITTGYNVNAVDLAERRLCKHAEAEALDRAFNAEFAKPGGDQKRAERAAKEALADVRAGKAPQAVRSSQGCV
jgi:hypothetical protein